MPCSDNRPGWLPDIPCPAYPESAALEGVASGNIAEASEVLTVAVDCEETAGGVAAADDVRGEMGFAAELQTFVDHTEPFQRRGVPMTATGMAVAVGVAVPKSAAVAVYIRMEELDPYRHPWMGWTAVA